MFKGIQGIKRDYFLLNKYYYIIALYVFAHMYVK